MKTLKQTLLASAIIGLAGVSAAHASTKDGFYLTPNAEIIFVGETFTKGVTAVGIGFGGGLNLGYQISNFQIELATNYQYYGGEGTVKQTITSDGQAGLAAGSAVSNGLTPGTAAFNATVAQLTPGFAGATSTTKVDSTEHFIPVTLGIHYVIPFNKSGSFSVTPGVAGGIWFHVVNRKSTSIVTLGNGTEAPAPVTIDEASEIKGVIVPSLSVEYAPSNNFTLSMASKFYIVPSGYSDNYSDTARATASAADGFFSPNYVTVDELFWYGSINLGARFTF